MAKQPGPEVYMMLQLAENARGADLRQIAEEGMRGAGYTPQAGGETRINGLDAYIGSYGGEVGSVGEVLARVAHIRHGRSVYVLGGIGPVDAFERVQEDINQSIRSFRALGRAEADSILPNEVALYIARDGDTWQSIAQRGGEEVVLARTLAIMNGYPVNEQPRAGDRLKIVVPGDR